MPADVAAVSSRSLLHELSPTERQVAAAAVALAENAPVVVLDRGDAALNLRDERLLLAAIVLLAGPQTTILIGTSDLYLSADAAPPDRPTVTVRLDPPALSAHIHLEDARGGLT